jgi:hypothetical protein
MGDASCNSRKYAALGSEVGNNGVNHVMSELIADIGEVAVFDARILRVRRLSPATVVIGRPQRIGSAMAYAALFEPDCVRLEGLREEQEMGPTVLAPGATEPVSREDRVPLR